MQASRGAKSPSHQHILSVGLALDHEQRPTLMHALCSSFRDGQTFANACAAAELALVVNPLVSYGD
jgi:hypothetical protein